MLLQSIDKQEEPMKQKIEVFKVAKGCLSTRKDFFLHALCPKSLHISCVVSNFYGTEIEIRAGFGPVGSTEKNNLVGNEQLLRVDFFMFLWAKKIL